MCSFLPVQAPAQQLNHYVFVPRSSGLRAFTSIKTESKQWEQGKDVLLIADPFVLLCGYSDSNNQR
jgi:hypothetical protein